eukprot:COSAG02_NODE_8864_length_2417_cov_3.556439_2_plen_194_part_00
MGFLPGVGFDLVTSDYHTVRLPGALAYGTQAPERNLHARSFNEIYILTLIFLNTTVISEPARTAAAAARTPPSEQAVQKRWKNGPHSPADGVSIGPGTLDRKNGTDYGPVQSCYFSRTAACEPGRRHVRSKPGFPARLARHRGRYGRAGSSDAAGGRVRLEQEAYEPTGGVRQSDRRDVLSAANTFHPCSALF